jgi:ABC-type phosphate transport system substrate-binding protein
MAGYIKYACATLLGLILSVNSPAYSADAGAVRPLAVVVHKTSKVDNLSAAELREILTGELRTWPDSTAVVVIEQPEDNLTQREMLHVLLRTTQAGYSRLLLQAQFQGKQPPLIKVLNSDEGAIKFVWNVPGAISVVDALAASSATSQVKAVRLDGKLPGENGYLLQ